MLTGINKNETKEYVSAFDKTDNPTVFVIGNIPNAQKMTLIGSVIGADGVVNKNALETHIAEIALAGLKGIKNFMRAGAKDPVELKEITSEVLEELPVEVLYEMAGKVIEYNFVSAAERKN